MKTRGLVVFVSICLGVLLSYTSVKAQEVDTSKDAKSKGAATKIKVVVTDALETAAEKTKNAVVETAKVGASSAQKFGKNTVEVSENAAGRAYEGGKWLTVTTWNGTKWVSKRVWHATKKAAETVKEKTVDN